VIWAFRLSATPLSAVSSAKDAAAIGNANMVMIARVLKIIQGIKINQLEYFTIWRMKIKN